MGSVWAMGEFPKSKVPVRISDNGQHGVKNDPRGAKFGRIIMKRKTVVEGQNAIS